MAFISYHMNLGPLSQRELKKALRQKEPLTESTKLKVRAELLRRGEWHCRH